MNTISEPRSRDTDRSPDSGWWPLVAVCIAVFMLLIDVTVVNVALPDIQRDLHANFSALQWVIDAYALTLAAFQLTSGSLGDRIGRKHVFVTGIVLFAVSSLACGLAPSPQTLDAFRAVQGIGGAVMFANSLAIIGENYVGRARGTAFGIWGATTGASIAIGPLVGGALTSGIGWRWIFFINLPIAAVAIAVALRRITSSPPSAERKIDWIGFVLFSGGLALLVYALIRGNDAGWTSAGILGLFAGAAVALLLFGWWEIRQPQPMLDVRLFRRAAFTGAQAAAFGLSASLFATFLYLTLYFQDILGYSAFDTGLRLLPITLMTFLAAPFAGRLSARVHFRVLIGGGLALVAVGLALMHGLSTGSAWTALLAGFLVAGFGSGAINPPLGSLATSVVDRHQSGMGAGVNNTFRQVGLATGIAVFGALFQSRVATSLAQSIPHATSGERTRLVGAVSSGGLDRAVSSVPAQLRHQVHEAGRAAFVSGLNHILLVGSVVALVAALLAGALIRQRQLLGTSG